MCCSNARNERTNTTFRGAPVVDPRSTVAATAPSRRTRTSPRPGPVGATIAIVRVRTVVDSVAPAWLDQVVLPHHNARLEHPDLSVRNVLVRGRGHMSLPIDGRVVHDISTLLSQLDSDGTTLRPGVASLQEDLSA